MARLLFGFGVLLILASILAMVLGVVSLVSIAGARLEGSARAVWVLIVLVFPLVGAILWLSIGRRDAQIVN